MAFPTQFTFFIVRNWGNDLVNKSKMKSSQPVRHFNQYFWTGCNHMTGHVSFNGRKRILFSSAFLFDNITLFYALIFSYLLEIIITVL